MITLTLSPDELEDLLDLLQTAKHDRLVVTYEYQPLRGEKPEAAKTTAHGMRVDAALAKLEAARERHKRGVERLREGPRFS